MLISVRRIFDEVANELVTSAEYFPDYGTHPDSDVTVFQKNILVSIGKIKAEIHVRIRELPIVDTLRDLRQNHLNQHEHVASISSIYDIIVNILNT